MLSPSLFLCLSDCAGSGRRPGPQGAPACFLQPTSGVSAPHSASFPIRQPKGQHQNRHRSCLHFGRERPQQIRSNLKFGREEIRFLTIPVSLGKRRYLRNTISASSNSRPCACASLQLCISRLRAFKRGRENDFDRIRFNTRTSLIKPTNSIAPPLRLREL